MHISFFGLLPHILLHSIVEQSFMGFYLIHTQPQHLCSKCFKLWAIGTLPNTIGQHCWFEWAAEEWLQKFIFRVNFFLSLFAFVILSYKTKSFSLPFHSVPFRNHEVFHPMFLMEVEINRTLVYFPVYPSMTLRIIALTLQSFLGQNSQRVFPGEFCPSKNCCIVPRTSSLLLKINSKHKPLFLCKLTVIWQTWFKIPLVGVIINQQECRIQRKSFIVQ